MTIRAYLRASSDTQDPLRAQQELTDFASEKGFALSCFYIETESGTHLKRPALLNLLNDAQAGDVILVEQVDRLSRLVIGDWEKLKAVIAAKGLRVVALDLPTSWVMFTPNVDEFTGRIFSAINALMLDVLAAVARKDHDDRVRRQTQGIEIAKEAGVYKGGKRRIDYEKVHVLNREGKGPTDIANALGISRMQVHRIIKNDSH